MSFLPGSRGTGPRATATLDTLFWQEGFQFAGDRPPRYGPLCSLRSPDRKHVRGGQAPALRASVSGQGCPSYRVRGGQAPALRYRMARNELGRRGLKPRLPGE